MPTASGAATGAACEYLGARFAPPTGWRVQEHRSATEPLPRISLTGKVGTHEILVSIIARSPLEQSGEPTAAEQTRLYFESLRRAGVTQGEVTEGRYPGPSRSYPVLVYGERKPGPLPIADLQHDNVILLHFPADYPRGGYFYVFFWTDIHLASVERGPVTELERLVDGFTVLKPPLGAASKGCGH